MSDEEISDSARYCKLPSHGTGGSVETGIRANSTSCMGVASEEGKALKFARCKWLIEEVCPCTGYPEDK